MLLSTKVGKAAYELAFHIAPLHGLLNDPNGLCEFKGVFHLFHQWNQTGLTHDNKSWGHLTSMDLVHWRRHSAALEPSEWYDKDGIYSGSAIEKDGVLHVFYTGNVINEDKTRSSYQCLATSEDGFHFEKRGPILPHPEGYTRHVRDPKVWFDRKKQRYLLILGAQKQTRLGDCLLYQSEDLYTWEALGSLFSEEEISQLSQRGYMWECPDLITIGEQEFLIFSPQGFEAEEYRFHNLYQTGYLKVTKEKEKYKLVDAQFNEIDWGFEFYAPQTFERNGSRILFGWMGPMMEEAEKNLPTNALGWMHGLTIPRILSTKENQFIQQPIKELQQLRSQKKSFSLQKDWQISVDQLTYEILLDFPEGAEDFAFKIKNETQIKYEKEQRILSLTRRNWVSGQLESRKIKLTTELFHLQMYIDGSSLELFVNEGVAVATSRFFEEGALQLTYQGENNGKSILYALDTSQVMEELE